MNTLEEIKNITAGLSVLIVDDEKVVRQFFTEALKDYFKEILHGANGKDGLAIFNSRGIDLIISDQKMPHMTGIEMIKAIRAKDREVPIIIVTAFTETDVLLEAINTGVNQFLVKPVKIDALYRAVQSSLVTVIAKRQRMLEVEAEALKYKEYYNSMQQRLALMKQQVIIKDDLYLGKVNHPDIHQPNTAWLIGAHYQPKDMLSGDFYSIRKIAPDKVLVFLADAMGKGLSAYVSSSIVTTFMNYSVDKSIEMGSFNLHSLIHAFVDYSGRQFTKDEALCAIFVLLDLSVNRCSIVNYGMPPLFAEHENGEVIKMASEGLPITKSYREADVRHLSLEGLNKILIMSDGLYDPSSEEQLISHLKASAFRGGFKWAYTKRDAEDDLTFIFLKRLRYTPDWSKTFVIEATIHGINTVTDEIEGLLDELGVSPKSAIELMSALSEMLLNAYEHGCLGLGKTLKTGSSGGQSMTSSSTQGRNNITATIERFWEADRPYFAIRVKDGGNGFDTSTIRHLEDDIDMLNYRGIRITKNLVDELCYNEKGNDVMLIKSCI